MPGETVTLQAIPGIQAFQPLTRHGPRVHCRVCPFLKLCGMPMLAPPPLPTISSAVVSDIIPCVEVKFRILTYYLRRCSTYPRTEEVSFTANGKTSRGIVADTMTGDMFGTCEQDLGLTTTGVSLWPRLKSPNIRAI